ncbi:MAG TPA: PKD domain-containing protein [Chryseolinea sp.]|nr:PKD domain-containing protein [Chryseolinea sp.]
MANPSVIYCIHAGDASQHFTKIQQIAQRLETERRISSFVAMSAEQAQTSLAAKLAHRDLVIIMLTEKLDPILLDLRTFLKGLRNNSPNITIAEIIIDNIPYESEFMNLPVNDDKPVRDRVNMDQVWEHIERDLNAMFPKRTFNWKKILVPAALAAVVALVIWFVATGSGPKSSFSFTVRDINSGRRLSDSSSCFLPCLVTFTSTTQDASALNWVVDDTARFEGASVDYPFLVPGQHKIELTAQKGSRSDVQNKTFLVKTSPTFQVGNDGCISPCGVQLTHNLGLVKSVQWEFDDGTSSQENSPTKQYVAPKLYNVKLTVTYEDDAVRSATQPVTIREKPTPFAKFTITKGGKRGDVPRVITFENTSENADEYIWQFGDGSAGQSTQTSPNITHTYNRADNFTVILTAKSSHGEATAANSFYIGPAERIIIGHLEDITIYQKVEKNPALNNAVKKSLHKRYVEP